MHHKLAAYLNFVLQAFLQYMGPFAELNDILDDAFRGVSQVGQLRWTWRGIGATTTASANCRRCGCSGRRRDNTGGSVQLFLTAMMMMVVHMEILLGLVLVLASLQVPLHVLHLVQDLAMLLAELSARCF